MDNANQEDVSDASKILSDDGTLSEAGFMSALGKSNPFKDNPDPIEDEPAEETEAEEPEEEPQGEPEEETAEETETEEAEEEQEETEEDDDSVLSQIDVDALSLDEKKELAKLIGSEVGQDNAKMRRENAELKQQLQSYQDQLQEGLGSISKTPDEFKDIKDVESLEEKHKEWKGFKKKIDELLVGTDEEIEWVDGKYYDRKEVAGWQSYLGDLLEQAPEYKQRLKDMKGYSQSEVLGKIREEIPAFEDEDSEVYKAWSKAVNDPKMAIIQQIAPKQWAQIQKWAAKAVAYGDKPAPAKKFKIPVKKPKNIGTRSTAANSSRGSGPDKARQAARERIQSGDYTDKDLRLAMFGA